MNKSLTRLSSSKLAGFTLVELLVVMGIIAILAGLLFGAGGMAIRAAQRAKAANLANQIQSGAMNYYTEYSVYPVPFGTTTDYTITDVTGDAAKWGTLIEILCGNIKPSTGLAAPTGQSITNARGIAFLSMKASDVDTTDAPKNPLPAKTTNPYFNIAIDSDYDGILGVTPSSVTSLPNVGKTPFGTAEAAGGGTSTAGIAVWANCNSSGNTTNAGFYVHTY